MAYDGKTNRLRRKEAVGMEALVRDFIREMKISSGVNRQRVAEAWNVVSGASAYTLGISYEKGTVYCSLSSSLVRNQLYFQRDVLMQKMNEWLEADVLFVREGRGGPIIKNLILR